MKWVSKIGSFLLLGPLLNNSLNLLRPSSLHLLVSERSRRSSMLDWLEKLFRPPDAKKPQTLEDTMAHTGRLVKSLPKLSTNEKKSNGQEDVPSHESGARCGSMIDNSRKCPNYLELSCLVCEVPGSTNEIKDTFRGTEASFPLMAKDLIARLWGCRRHTPGPQKASNLSTECHFESTVLFRSLPVPAFKVYLANNFEMTMNWNFIAKHCYVGRLYGPLSS